MNEEKREPAPDRLSQEAARCVELARELPGVDADHAVVAGLLHLQRKVPNPPTLDAMRDALRFEVKHALRILAALPAPAKEDT